MLRGSWSARDLDDYPGSGASSSSTARGDEGVSCLPSVSFAWISSSSESEASEPASPASPSPALLEQLRADAAEIRLRLRPRAASADHGAHKPPPSRTGSARAAECAARADGVAGGGECAALQVRTFVLIYGAYVGLLIARKNYGFWLPHAIEALSLETPKDVAVVGSAFEIASGYGALLNGFLIDAFDPALGLAAALAASSLVNLALSGTSSLTLMALLWGVNGAAQSFGWPCVSRLFLRAFPEPKGRGVWYSLLSTSQNVGAALVPLLVSSAVSLTAEPRAAFWLPAAVTACLALLLLLALAPERGAAAAGAPAAPVTPRRDGRGVRVLLLEVLGSWQLWSMAATYFAIGIIRACLTDWSPIFLREDKGLSTLAASRCLCAFELGGFVGSICAGRVSDRCCAGRRGPVIACCTALLCPALLALAAATTERALVPLYFALGGLAFPVHVLLGLASREVVAPAASSTAGGLVKFVAQMGASSAGYPLSLLQRQHGWRAVLCMLSAAAAGGGALASTLWWTVARVDAPALRQPHKRKGG